MSSAHNYYGDSPSVYSILSTAVCGVLYVVRTMGRRMFFHGFNIGHNQRKKSSSTKNSAICLVSSQSYYGTQKIMLPVFHAIAEQTFKLWGAFMVKYPERLSFFMLH